MEKRKRNLKPTKKELNFMLDCSKCFKSHGNKCAALTCYNGLNDNFPNEDKNINIEMELREKVINDNKKPCIHALTIKYYEKHDNFKLIIEKCFFCSKQIKLTVKQINYM